MFYLASGHGISGLMPSKVSILMDFGGYRPPLRVGRFMPRRRPLKPDNGHLVGH